MATAKRLASYREERCAFQTCVRQAAAIYGQKLSSGDFSADGKFTEAALCFNVLNGSWVPSKPRWPRSKPLSTSWSGSTAPPASSS